MSFSFQNTVDKYQAVATVGDRANQNPTVYSVVNFLAGSGGVKQGEFCFRSASAPETEVVRTGTSAMQVEGFIERTMNVNGFTYDAGSMDVAEGENVSVARKGDFYVKADASVSIGDTVYADYANGGVTFTSGATTTDSGFKAASAGASGDMVIITSWD